MALRVRVVEVVRETADAHTLVLEPVDGDTADRFRYRPGQFLTVRVPTDRPGGAARSYSLCSSPVCDEKLKVTVKRVAGGYGSNWICDNVTEGDVLEVLRPAGTFTPKSLDADFLLLAAGSGITPVMSVLKSCLYGGTGRVVLVYANRDENSVIFRDELMALAREHGDRLTVVHWLESVQGLPSAAGLRALTAPYTGREAFICGPGPFMDLAVAVLADLGVPAGRVRVERFSSLTDDPFAVPAVDTADESGASSGASSGDQAGAAPAAGSYEVEVELDGVTSTVTGSRHAKVLDALLRAGLDAPYSCREGNCSACACILLEGEVEMERNEVLEDADLADGLILACQSIPLTPRIKITYEG